MMAYMIRRTDPKPPMYYQGPTMDRVGRCYSANALYGRKYEDEWSARRDAEKGEEVVLVRAVVDAVIEEVTHDD